MDFQISNRSMRNFDGLVTQLRREVGLSAEDTLRVVAQHILSSARGATPQAKRKKRKIYKTQRGNYAVYPKYHAQMPVFTSSATAKDLPKHVKSKLNKGLAKEGFRQIQRILNLKPAKSAGAEPAKYAQRQVQAKFVRKPFLRIEFEDENRVVANKPEIMSKAFARGTRRMNYLLNKLGADMEKTFK